MKTKHPEIPERVKRRLERWGMSISTLADRMGVQASTVSRFLNGDTSEMIPEHMERMRIILEMPCGWPMVETDLQREAEHLVQSWMNLPAVQRRSFLGAVGQASSFHRLMQTQPALEPVLTGEPDWPGEKRLLAAVRALSDDERETLLQFLEQVAERERSVPKQ